MRSFLSSTFLLMPCRQASRLSAGSRSSVSRSPAKALMSAVVGEEAFLDQPRADAAHDRRDLAQRIFRMILHAPGDRAVGADFRALHVRHRIGGEHGGARRQRLDLVEMHGRRVEHVELADIHRMLAAGFGQPDAAAEADLAALRIFAARCRRPPR